MEASKPEGKPKNDADYDAELYEFEKEFEKLNIEDAEKSEWVTGQSLQHDAVRNAGVATAHVAPKTNSCTRLNTYHLMLHV